MGGESFGILAVAHRECQVSGQRNPGRTGTGREIGGSRGPFKAPPAIGWKNQIKGRVPKDAPLWRGDGRHPRLGAVRRPSPNRPLVSADVPVGMGQSCAHQVTLPRGTHLRECRLQVASVTRNPEITAIIGRPSHSTRYQKRASLGVYCSPREYRCLVPEGAMEPI